MTYHEMKEMLQEEFKAAPKNLAPHSRKLCLNKEIDLTLSYPGYKTTTDKMDFKISLKGKAVSHENIINDIWGKLASGAKPEVTPKVTPDVLKTFLFDIAENGIIPNKKDYDNINNCDGYSLDEFLSTIAWIALQEDINYPMPRCQGRKMPFYRYIEAIYVYANPQNPFNLDKKTVLQRTNVTGKPPVPIKGFDYGIIHQLKGC